MVLFIIIVVVALIVYVLSSSGSKPIVSDDVFQQYGVSVNFKKGTISIGKHIYNVNQVTGIRTVNEHLKLRGVEIQVDDFIKPIHKVAVPGNTKTTEMFAQRLSVALRKAGGPNFV